MMIRLIETLLGFKRVTVTERERVLVLKDGQFDAILRPGRHLMYARNRVRETYDLGKFRFASSYDAALFRARSDLVADHLTELRAGVDEVLVVSRDGRLFELLRPEERAVYWTDAGPWTVDRVDVSGDLTVTDALAQRLVRSGVTAGTTAVEVPEGHVALMTLDGALVGRLAAGAHRHWALGRKVAVKLVDMRWRLLDVAGQEILTKDRVSLRVNLTATFRVTDPERAVGVVKDFEEALHRALQLAFRKTLGALSLDQLLADKVAVDAEAAGVVRAEMAGLGIEVGEIALKDVILPGEMREILNQVVTAQKAAEANVIRRREETNATRSLLNTAKVMDENPTMLRLKELEALESIAGKVQHLTVHNGVAGLMSDLVKLRD